MNEQAWISMRVTPDTKKALRALALADGRSLSNYLERLLARHLEERVDAVRADNHLPAPGSRSA